jgi:hypothetical protein
MPADELQIANTDHNRVLNVEFFKIVASALFSWQLANADCIRRCDVLLECETRLSKSVSCSANTDCPKPPRCLIATTVNARCVPQYVKAKISIGETCKRITGGTGRPDRHIDLSDIALFPHLDLNVVDISVES